MSIKACRPVYRCVGLAMLGVLMMAFSSMVGGCTQTAKPAPGSVATPNLGATPTELGTPEPESVEEEDTQDTARWESYRNIEQGFEIRFPPIGKWSHTVELDEKREGNRRALFDASFHVSEEQLEVSLGISIDLFSEVTPPLPPWPFCRQEKEMSLWQDTISETMYSRYSSEAGVDEHDCGPSADEFLLDEHLLETRFCASRAPNAYSPELRRNEEYSYFCSGEDRLYHFALYCKGETWQGEEGRQECDKLFAQVISTFRLLEK